jgi:hypothetical protein
MVGGKRQSFDEFFIGYNTIVSRGHHAVGARQRERAPECHGRRGRANHRCCTGRSGTSPSLRTVSASSVRIKSADASFLQIVVTPNSTSAGHRASAASIGRLEDQARLEHRSLAAGTSTPVPKELEVSLIAALRACVRLRFHSAATSTARTISCRGRMRPLAVSLPWRVTARCGPRKEEAVCRCSRIASAIAKISATRPRSRLYWRPFLSYPRSISSHCLAKYDTLAAKQDISGGGNNNQHGGCPSGAASSTEAPARPEGTHR